MMWRLFFLAAWAFSWPCRRPWEPPNGSRPRISRTIPCPQPLSRPRHRHGGITSMWGAGRRPGPGNLPGPGPAFAARASLVDHISLFWFGFWRKGCICPIGSIQNVALAAVDSSYAIPWSVILFFALPILFTLFFGRTFARPSAPWERFKNWSPETDPRAPLAGPGPVLAPFPLPWAAVILAATGTTFLICSYDPFVVFSGYRVPRPCWFLGLVSWSLACLWAGLIAVTSALMGPFLAFVLGWHCARADSSPGVHQLPALRGILSL